MSNSIPEEATTSVDYGNIDLPPSYVDNVQDTEREPLHNNFVQDILENDLEPITVSQVPYEGGQLVAKKPIMLTPTLSEDKQFFVIDDETLGISLSAFTRCELIEYLYENIAFLWKEYAQEHDYKMTDSAQVLKRRLLKVFDEQN